MRIGLLSQRTGVSQRLLRYYEEQGLLNPTRRPSGYREYDEEDVRRVQNIRTLLAAGLGTERIADLLPCMTDVNKRLAPACLGVLPGLEEERDRLTNAVAELIAARTALDALITAAPEEPDTCLLDGDEPGGATADEPFDVDTPATTTTTPRSALRLRR
ncbi:MerR family transcriptional regulator [Goodfellowiella coeruleoviolacea]|uniref:DNA-binding transcriptional regulator, MerR family n=1 Tax=Goodfellowiella coeruleoviolacea TaxID=334858 RepID=A0AAE3GJS0_9PSEU|nr:MerR family transcriptional regulator [Goodfellowiella coeruleoviolacea]MCP2168843.1 DNA-binding transcriptional regulator, MerR family [Goodfellowiella coeruleoviolacea]